MPKKSFCYEFPRASITVDVVSVRKGKSGPEMLLIRRANPPFEGFWAFPGGFIEMDETLKDAACRELEEETRLRVSNLEPLGVWDNPVRDPRGRTLSFVFLARVSSRNGVARGADDAAEARWFPLSKVPKELAFDHASILAAARRRLRQPLRRRRVSSSKKRKPAASRG